MPPHCCLDAMKPSKYEMELLTTSPSLLTSNPTKLDFRPMLVGNNGILASSRIVESVPEHDSSDVSQRSLGDRSEAEDTSDEFVHSAVHLEQHHELLDAMMMQSDALLDTYSTAPMVPNHRLPNLIRRLRRHAQVYGEQSIAVAETWNTIGLVQCRIYQNYPRAIQCHGAALHIFQSLIEEEESSFDPPPLGDLRLPLIVTYMDLGTSYELLQNYPLALQSYRAAEALIQTGVPRHIDFSCRRALARLQRL